MNMLNDNLTDAANMYIQHYYTNTPKNANTLQTTLKKGNYIQIMYARGMH